MHYIREKERCLPQCCKSTIISDSGDLERSRLVHCHGNLLRWEREISARPRAVAAAGTRRGRWSSSCKHPGRRGQRGHHPKLTRGKELVCGGSASRWKAAQHGHLVARQHQLQRLPCAASPPGRTRPAAAGLWSGRTPERLVPLPPTTTHRQLQVGTCGQGRGVAALAR